jgi:hypothetical protein
VSEDTHLPRILSIALCAAAMAAGLWVDTREAPLDLLAAWCAAPDTPWLAAWRHWQGMPAAHALMVGVAWLTPQATGALGRTVHALALLVGMTAVALLGPALARLTGWPPAEALLVAMALGMLLAGLLLPGPAQPTPAIGNPAASVSRR